MSKHIIGKAVIGAVALACVGLPIASGQEKPAPAPAAQAPPSNDPFFRVPPKKTKAPEQKDADKPVLIPFPTLDQRQAEFQRIRQETLARRLPEPDAIQQYLVSELQVTGVFETDEGVGAFILAGPTNTTFFAKAGTRVYNGEIVSINTGTDFTIGQVVFRELTKYRIRKKEENRVNMITKAVTAPVRKGK